jgi:hypothetical protein
LISELTVDLSSIHPGNRTAIFFFVVVVVVGGGCGGVAVVAVPVFYRVCQPLVLRRGNPTRTCSDS